MKFDAFISYSHAADGTLAPALQTGLHRLAKPWYALRALRVFRDETNLAAEPGLWPMIEAALAQSRFLILMASPAAARSAWVAKELDWWLGHGKAAHLLIVQSAGELDWDDAGRDFDWSRTDALPATLKGRFSDEPKYVDLRWAHATDAPLTLDNPAFRAAVLDLAAPVHGKDKDLLDGDDVRQLARTRWLARSAVAGLVGLTIASSIAAFVAVRQNQIAQTQRALAVEQGRIAVEQGRISLARQLAAQSGLLLRQNPDLLPLSVLLAVESVQRFDSFEGNQALRAALALLPQVEWSTTPANASPSSRVRALGFSPDGKLLAAARDDGTADLLDVRAHRVVATLVHDANPGADAEVVALAFSADGRLLATASNDHSARLWDTATGRPAASLAHDDSVVAVAFHPTRPWLASGSKDGSARLWNTGDGSLLRRFEGDDEVRAVAFSPDGRFLATLDTGGCSRLVDLDVEAAAPRTWCFGSAGLSLVFSADGSRLATANGDRAAVYAFDRAGAAGRAGGAAAGTGVAVGAHADGVKRVFEATHLTRREDGNPEHFKWIQQVAFSADGESLATAGRDGTARVWDLSNGQELTRLAHQAPVEALAFSPDGAQLLSASFDGTARLWDLPSGRERLRAVQPGGSEGVAFDPRGQRVASGGSAGAIDLWRLASGDQLLDLDATRADAAGAAAPSTAASAAATRGNARDAASRSTDSPASTHAVAATAAIAAVAVAPDGRIASVDSRGELRFWSSDGALLGRRTGLFNARRLVFAEDGHHLLALAQQPPASLFDLDNALAPLALDAVRDTSDPIASPRYAAARDRQHNGVIVWPAGGGAALRASDDVAPSKLLFDATGKHLASLHQDERGHGTIRVRSLPALQEIGRIAIDRQPEFALAPGGALLAISARERADERSEWKLHVDLIDVASGKPVRRFAEERELGGLQFTPDGAHLLTLGASDETARELRVWDVTSGRLVARLRHETEIRGVRVAARGDVLSTRSGDQLRVWAVGSGALLSQVDTGARFQDAAFSADGNRLVTGSSDGRVAAWRWRSDELRAEACKRLARNLDADEWARYLGSEPYRATCPALDVVRAAAEAASASSGAAAAPAPLAASVARR